MQADCSWERRAAAFIVWRSLANFPFSLLPNSEARLAKSLPAICYMLRHTQTLIFFLFPCTQEKRRNAAQPGFGIPPRDVVGRRARRALCYYHGGLCRPSADMRYLITLTPPGNKKKEQEVCGCECGRRSCGRAQ